MAYISGISTSPEYRKRGIAFRLKKQICEYLKREGYSQLIEVVDPENKTAINIDKNGLMEIGHIGDTRCYVLSDRKLIQLTQDHNVPGFQNILEKALGSNEKIEVEHQDFQLKNGDVVLLCSDGLYNEFSDEYLKKKLQEGISADTLVGEVLIQKPKDNVSAVVINIFEK